MNGVLRKMSELSIESTVAAVKDQVSAEMDGEIVILDAKSGQYYGLDEVGAIVWDLVQRPRTVASIRNAIVADYDVEPERCEQDVLALLNTMMSKGLVELKNDDETGD